MVQNSLLGRVGGFLGPSYTAALALIVVQVGTGLLYRSTHIDGRYAFSVSASIAVSEFLRFLSSAALFIWELQRRTLYSPVSDDAGNEEAHKLEPIEEDESEDQESNTSFDLAQDDRMSQSRIAWLPKTRSCGPRGFYEAVVLEVGSDIRFGFVHLALLYMVVNNMIFVIRQLANPVTNTMIQSSTTLITAVLLIAFLGANIVGNQWLAITLQVCGVIITQQSPESGYQATTYGFLLFHTIITAISGVYNQKLCKQQGSLHAMNIVLFGAGTCMNLVLHLLVRIMDADEPGFFAGYGSGAVPLILSNVLVGLAMTTVYRYADALIKCFATAISTVCLVYVYPHSSPKIVPGILIVFMASWLYVTSSSISRPPSRERKSEVDTLHQEKPSWSVGKVFEALSPQGVLKVAGLAFTTTLTFTALVFLTVFQVKFNEPVFPALDVSNQTMNGTMNSTAPRNLLESPFKNTMSFIRINRDLPERIPTLRNAYEPYFQSVHISMPGRDPTQTNLTHDSWNEKDCPYTPVARTIELLLEDPESAVEGILWYHFDSWIEPLSFSDMDFSKIWVLDGTDPPFECFVDYSPIEGWQWVHEGKHNATLRTMRESAAQLAGYVYDPEEFCRGWSDLYYLPRIFFKDYVYLANLFAANNAFHEIAIPTLFHIIDQTYREHPTRHVYTRWSDCWGSCCSERPRPHNLLQKRCGHKLDFPDEKTTMVHFERLEENRRFLGQEIPDADVSLHPGFRIFESGNASSTALMGNGTAARVR